MRDRIENRIGNVNSLQESLKLLEELLSGGYSIWRDGSLYRIKQVVGRVNGLKFEIHSNEHPPPHFHLSGGGIKASFSIETCEILEGGNSLSRREIDLVKYWYKNSKSKLIVFWNKTRPSDCSVGNF